MWSLFSVGCCVVGVTIVKVQHADGGRDTRLWENPDHPLTVHRLTPAGRATQAALRARREREIAAAE